MQQVITIKLKLLEPTQAKQEKKKAKHFKRLWPGFNNQNFRVEKETAKDGGAVWKVSFPTLEKRVGVPIELTCPFGAVFVYRAQIFMLYYIYSLLILSLYRPA